MRPSSPRGIRSVARRQDQDERAACRRSKLYVGLGRSGYGTPAVRNADPQEYAHEPCIVLVTLLSQNDTDPNRFFLIVWCVLMDDTCLWVVTLRIGL